MKAFNDSKLQFKELMAILALVIIVVIVLYYLGMMIVNVPGDSAPMSYQ